MVNNIKLKTEPVWTDEGNPKAWRAIWQYRTARARRDTKTLDAHEARAKAVVAGDKKAKPTRFVTVKGDDRTLDQTSLARARDLIGLKGYVTNLDATQMPAAEVIGKYHELCHVEKSFRMSKHDLAARPIFHHLKDSIEAHLTIVFATLAVSHADEDKDRPIHRQSRQAAVAIAISDHRDQRHAADIPASDPRRPTRNRHPPRSEAGALTK